MILAVFALLKATNLEAVDLSLKTNFSQRMASLSSIPLCPSGIWAKSFLPMAFFFSLVNALWLEQTDAKTSSRAESTVKKVLKRGHGKAIK